MSSRRIRRTGETLSALAQATIAVVTLVGLITITGCPAFAAPASGTGKQTASAAEGAALFKQRCSRCHFTDKTTFKVGPGLKGLFTRKKLPVSGRPVTPANIHKQLRTPFDEMQAFPDLTEKQIKALIDYLKTL